MVKVVNDTLCFLLELGMLASIGFFGMTRSWPLISRLLFIFFFISIVIYLWSAFAAPKSKRRLKMPYLTIFRMVLFIGGALLFFLSGYLWTAIMVFVLSIITQIVGLFTDK